MLQCGDNFGHIVTSLCDVPRHIPMMSGTQVVDLCLLHTWHVTCKIDVGTYSHSRQQRDTTMIPKSLHTVTVLVAVATHLRTEERHIIPNTPVLPSSCYVDRAAELLGYRFDCDTYGLKARAASVMDKA